MLLLAGEAKRERLPITVNQVPWLAEARGDRVLLERPSPSEEPELKSEQFLERQPPAGLLRILPPDGPVVGGERIGAQR